MIRAKKRSWNSYLLEFFMLFFAVSLGFMADNLRDKASENRQELEYIESMIEDVEEDRANISRVININNQKILRLDTLSNMCFKYSGSEDDKLTINKFFVEAIVHPEFFTSTELTMQQLKNAGGMRFIKKKKAINEIIRYDTKLKEIANQQLYYENYQNKAIEIGTDIFNINAMLFAIRNMDGGLSSNVPDLLNEDPLKLMKLGNNVTMYQGIVLYYVRLLEELKEQGTIMEQTLRDAYAIK